MYRLFAYASLALAILCANAGAATEHRVTRGETLTEIAHTYKVSVKDIEAANNLRNANELKVGQTLTIPTASGASASSAKKETTIHRVRKGETLTEIAQAYKISVKDIEAANRLSNANQLAVGQDLTIPAPAPVVIDYKIRHGDNLSDIASRYGVSLSELKNLNAIRNSNKIRVGQVLKIPVASGSALAASLSAPPGPQLSSSDLKSLARTRAKKNQWKHIVIHHSATTKDSAKGMDRYHREERNMENGLAYHFVIGNGRGMEDGEIYIGERWKRQIQGGHLSSYTLNQVSVGICLVGDFSKNRPTAKQMETLEALVRYVMEETNVPASRVTTHTLIHPRHTLCPGKYFPTDTFKAKLAK